MNADTFIGKNANKPGTPSSTGYGDCNDRGFVHPKNY